MDWKTIFDPKTGLLSASRFAQLYMGKTAKNGRAFMSQRLNGFIKAAKDPKPYQFTDKELNQIETGFRLSSDLLKIAADAVKAERLKNDENDEKK